MVYAELVYFEGAHFAHIVAREEHFRLQRILQCRSNRSPAQGNFLVPHLTRATTLRLEPRLVAGPRDHIVGYVM
jgi:hypothetical protein